MSDIKIISYCKQATLVLYIITIVFFLSKEMFSYEAPKIGYCPKQNITGKESYIVYDGDYNIVCSW